MVAHLLVLLVAVGLVRLGIWQLDRHEERQVENAVGESRFSGEPFPLGHLLADAGPDLASLVYRRATVTGTFDPDHEVLIRSQVHLGTAGFHVVTPLVGESGVAVLVNRGWVPLVLDEVPVREALPPQGEVTVQGWVSTSQQPAALGPRDPAEGRLGVLNQVDIDRIGLQMPYALAPVYLVELEERDSLPAPLSRPRFDEQGPHLAYAVQWFGFATVGLVGYVFLARRQIGSG